jgi:hypothetical protein
VEASNLAKIKYSIEIKPPAWKGYRYAIFYRKHYGDCLGGATEFKTKEELLAFIRRLFKRWEAYDSILEKMPDKVTPENLHFESFTDEISKMELFGNKTLADFLSDEEKEADADV